MKKTFLSFALSFVFLTVSAETYHKVRPGETFETIASKYNITVDALKKANAEIDKCYAGTMLEIPLVNQNSLTQIDSKPVETKENKPIQTTINESDNLSTSTSSIDTIEETKISNGFPNYIIGGLYGSYGFLKDEPYQFEIGLAYGILGESIYCSSQYFYEGIFAKGDGYSQKCHGIGIGIDLGVKLYEDNDLIIAPSIGMEYLGILGGKIKIDDLGEFDVETNGSYLNLKLGANFLFSEDLILSIYFIKPLEMDGMKISEDGYLKLAVVF